MRDGKDSVVAFFATTALDGKTYQVDFYSLDLIISVGYRVNSKVATHFRKWATKNSKLNTKNKKTNGFNFEKNLDHQTQAVNVR